MAYAITSLKLEACHCNQDTEDMHFQKYKIVPPHSRCMLDRPSLNITAFLLGRCKRAPLLQHF